MPISPSLKPVACVLLLAVTVLRGTAPAKTYEAIKGESTLAYVLKHPMHKVHGMTKDFECQVELAPDTVSSSIRVKAKVKTFNSGNSNRDSHAMESIDALKFPTVEFASDSVRREGGGYTIHGRLTFHGKTRPVSFPVKHQVKGNKVNITGGFAVKLSDFGVKRPSLLFVPTEDKLTIQFDLYSPVN